MTRNIHPRAANRTAALLVIVTALAWLAGCASGTTAGGILSVAGLDWFR